MSGRPKRSTKPRNYVDLHHGRKSKALDHEYVESSKGDNHSGDEVSIHSELDEEFNTTEEGEITDSSGSETDLEGSELDEAIKQAFNEDNIEKAEKLLNKKERRCEKLKLELVLEEKNKEIAERRRRKRIMEEKFKKLQEKEVSLNKSLASSRSSTLISSPKSKKKADKSKKKNTLNSSEKKRKQHKKSPKGNPASRRKLDNETSEYPNLINTLTSMKHGKAEAFSELMVKAIQSRDNLQLLGVNESFSNDSKVGDEFSENENSEGEKSVANKVGHMQL